MNKYSLFPFFNYSLWSLMYIFFSRKQIKNIVIKYKKWIIITMDCFSKISNLLQLLQEIRKEDDIIA